MLLTRLYLRNFRVYEDELDLALPPGLVGIYGPNGAGKSTLLEAITFALWGRARTDRSEIRSAGVGGDCVVELEFEHEGHLYAVRRWLTGINSTMKAEALCDGLALAEGATDTKRYVQSVLGMDDGAFRASVFAEQKQLAAFSSQSPAERRRLVLQLLGITPLDGARDTARKDARERDAQLNQLRAVLPDLEVLTVAAADADAAAGAAEAEARAERAAADTATAAARAAQERWAALDQLRQQWDALVLRGQAARSDLDRDVQAVTDLTGELAALDAAGNDLAAAEAAASDLDGSRARHAALRALLDARRRLDRSPLGPEPPDPAPAASAAAAARKAAADAAERRAALQGQLAAAEEEARRAQEHQQRSAALSAEASCPLCGQELGAAFASVQEHRQAEVVAADARVGDLRARWEAQASEAVATAEAAADAERAERELRDARSGWELARATRASAEEALRAASADLAAAGGSGGAPVDAAALGAAALETLMAAEQATLRTKEQAADTATRLRTRLERRPVLETALAAARGRVDASRDVVEALREEVRALGFDRDALGAAAAARDAATDAARRAEDAARTAELAAATRRSQADGEATRLADGRAQHERLADLESEARHLARVAVLLSEFRNTVVASVGPRLAAQAAELFGELTDREYDRLLVDPETYELQISDAGRVYGLDRFSGSEVDLANLALRVAISEHVRFQSGGTVGLLVLDEVFGPLDEDRKARMLQALEQLRGRFRQVLVVTHDAGIKEQLPNALEVVKLAGRRATARVLG